MPIVALLNSIQQTNSIFLFTLPCAIAAKWQDCAHQGPSNYASVAKSQYRLAIGRKIEPEQRVYPEFMPNNLARFSIHADNVQRARKFYQDAFGWSFEPWGPPNFYLIETGQSPIPPVGGVLEERHAKVPGVRMTGYECTIGVENMEEAMVKVESAGGKLVVPRFQIPTVGSGAYYQDTEGNTFCIMQYEKK